VVDTGLVVLILGGIVVVGALVLLWRAQSGGSLKVSLSDVFKLDLTLSPQNTASAQEAVRDANKKQGHKESTAELTDVGKSSVLARILWVDDVPDNNVYETLALADLGKFVTVATSTEAARAYLSRMDFAAIITDLSRNGDGDAGLKFIQEVRATGNRVPIIVYTSHAPDVPSEVRDAGADAIVDLPHKLVSEVESRVVSGRSR
jgi:CheY-like chemotaxis protein